MSRGLLNVGNTCYFNSAIQCLAHVPALTNRFLRDGPYEGQCEVTREYSLLVRSLWNRHSKDSLDASDLLRVFQTRCPQFTPGRQHDTHEAVLALVDIFEKSLGLDYMKSLFYGKEDQIVTYPKGTSKRTNEFMSLFVEKLDDYSKHQVISGYEDDDGQKYHVAALQTKITQTGHCLTVTFTQKCLASTIPEMFEGMHLFGIVVHWGIARGGHYAVFVKHKKKWRMVDDDAVLEIEKPYPNAPCSMAWYKKMI